MGIERIHIRNYRALAGVRFALGPVNLFFGPNGSGKSTLLDALWFVRDCAVRGVESASARRGHGVGLLFDGASDDDRRILIELSTEAVSYCLVFDLSGDRAIPLVGETLQAHQSGEVRIVREVGSGLATLYHDGMKQSATCTMRDRDKLTLGLYVDFHGADKDTASLDSLLRFVRYYHSRSFLLHGLKAVGSSSGPDVRLSETGENAWSVLRNLHDRRNRDDRFGTVMQYMREAFPSIEDIGVEQTGPMSVYASFCERSHRNPIPASGVSDGHLQLLLLLLSLFSEGSERDAMILLDEPETSLHPRAIAVLAKAIRAAGVSWRKQVLVATHSPVLISQFEPSEIVVTQTKHGRTHLARVSEMENVRDLIDDYAVGSLYMAGAIGAQGEAEAAG